MRINPARLSRAMERARIGSQRDLAERVGVAPSRVSEWVTQKTTPRSEHLMTLCRVLQCTAEYLFGGNRAATEADG